MGSNHVVGFYLAVGTLPDVYLEDRVVDVEARCKHTRASATKITRMFIGHRKVTRNRGLGVTHRSKVRISRLRNAGGSSEGPRISAIFIPCGMSRIAITTEFESSLYVPQTISSSITGLTIEASVNHPEYFADFEYASARGPVRGAPAPKASTVRIAAQATGAAI